MIIRQNSNKYTEVVNYTEGIDVAGTVILNAFLKVLYKVKNIFVGKSKAKKLANRIKEKKK